MVGLSEKHFLDIVEELVKTRWPNSSQPGMAKPDCYPSDTIGYFHGTLTGLTRWSV